MDDVEEDDLRENPADALFSGSPLSPFWFSWRLLCVFFGLAPFTKVDLFNVMEEVASGTMGGTVGDDHTVVGKSRTTCSLIPVFQDCLFSSQLSSMCIISFLVCMDSEIIMRKKNVSKHCHVWVSVGVKSKN